GFTFAQNAFVKDSLDTYVQREMKHWKVPGMAVAIVKDGKVVVCKGYGIKDITHPEQKVDANTLFQIASNSKAFTGTSIALLAYQKRLSLDDKVHRWMPDFKLKDPFASEDIRIRDLLCHRLGFETFQSDFYNWGGTPTRKEIITNLRHVDAVYPFRSHYGYCNAGFLTAGELIPLVTDTTWDDFLKYHFFQPLHMDHTSTTWKTISSDPNACKPYTLVDGKLVVMPFVNVDNLGPAASINSCVNDLSHWLLMQLDSGRYEGKTVFPFSVLQSTRASNTVVHDQNNPYFHSKHFQTYGLGWFLEDYEGKKIISHDGGANGFVTTTCFIPELNLGIVVLTNTDQNNLYGALRQQIIDSYLNLPWRNYSDYYRKREVLSEQKEAKQKEIWKYTLQQYHSPAFEPKEYTGTYKNDVYGLIDIVEENKSLVIHFSHHPALKGNLQYLDKETFLCTYSDPEYGVEETSFNEKDNKVMGVTIRINGFIDFMPYEFTKVNP
ncbi:MAG TPA: serine hydrolase, partial [Bacteroidia bacterium]|nr:serine hydrolase [Bacteroidia bacterium]